MCYLRMRPGFDSFSMADLSGCIDLHGHVGYVARNFGCGRTPIRIEVNGPRRVVARFQSAGARNGNRAGRDE